MFENPRRSSGRGWWLTAASIACFWTPDAQAQSGASQRIALLLDGPTPGLQMLLGRAQEELGRFGHDVEALFPPSKVQTGDFTIETATRQLDAALKDPEVDMVWAFGLVASAAAVKRAEAGRLRKPVVAPFVLAPWKRRLEKPTASTSNLSYVVFTPALSRDLETLRLAVRPLRHVAYLLSPAIREAIPSLEAVLEAEAAKLDIRLHFASGADPRALIDALPPDIDAVYVGLAPRRSPADLEALVTALIANKLPSFAQVGRLGVDRGLLMGLGSPENSDRLARAVAVNTDAILQGEAPKNLSYVFQRAENLVINAKTAKAIGLPLSWAVISEAELIAKDEAKTAPTISLQEVVTEVREQNLVLRANREELAAREASVNDALGALLPRVDASLSGTWRDPDSATGLNPERSASWSGTASQVVLNEPAMAQLTINKHLRDATRSDNRTAVLDTVQSAAVAYLDVLRALTTERVQRDNLKVTRTQLDQTRLRLDLGTGSQNERLRLENQLATNRTTVIDAVASRNVAEIDLLRLLNRATEEPFVPEDASLVDSRLMASGERLQSYMTGPRRFAILRTFMAAEALGNSPELQASASRLAAQRRLALSTNLAPFLPQVAVNGNVTHTFANGGAGTTPEAQSIFPIDEVTWQVGFTANLNLLEGGSRFARIKQENAEARAQALDLEARRIQIETSLRSTLHRAGASYAAIAIQREAAEAADENLRLVQAAYAQGKEDIITLVDAQNQALTGKLNADTAVYDFLIDLVAVQRAMGRFDFSMSDDDVDEFFQRLQAFAATQETNRD